MELLHRCQHTGGKRWKPSSAGLRHGRAPTVLVVEAIAAEQVEKPENLRHKYCTYREPLGGILPFLPVHSEHATKGGMQILTGLLNPEVALLWTGKCFKIYPFRASKVVRTQAISSELVSCLPC